MRVEKVQMVSTLLKLLNISAVHIKSAECRQNGKSCFYGSLVKRKHANGSSTKRYHQTLALMGATRLASGKMTLNKGSQIALITRQPFEPLP